MRYDATGEHTTFALDLAAAYPASAGVQRWDRSYDLQRGAALRINDSYTLAAAGQPNELHFLTARPVDLSQPGVVRLGGFPGADSGRDAELHYDASVLTAVIESKTVEDDRLRETWGPKVHLLKLIERAPAAQGSLTVEILPAAAR